MHWENNLRKALASGGYLQPDDFFSETCPCCMLYLKGDSCGDCPIAAYSGTKETYCCSPWQEVKNSQAYTAGTRRKIEAIENMIVFLRKVLFWWTNTRGNECS